MKRSPSKVPHGHNLLEAIVAAALFIVIAVALSGVWVMYGSALAKSGEQMAANHLARALTEGLISNGYEWLQSNPNGPAPPSNIYEMDRSVRGRDSTVSYRLKYLAEFNTTGTVKSNLPRGAARLTVSVSWNSDRGSKASEDGLYNNTISYSSWIYKAAVAP